MNDMIRIGLKLQELGIRLQVAGSTHPPNRGIPPGPVRPVRLKDVMDWRDADDFKHELRQLLEELEGEEEI